MFQLVSKLDLELMTIQLKQAREEEEEDDLGFIVFAAPVEVILSGSAPSAAPKMEEKMDSDRVTVGSISFGRVLICLDFCSSFCISRLLISMSIRAHLESLEIHF